MSMFAFIKAHVAEETSTSVCIWYWDASLRSTTYEMYGFRKYIGKIISMF